MNYRKFIDIIPIQAFRLSNRLNNFYLDRLVNLTESYDDIKFDKEDVKCSLQSVKLDLENNDKETILDDLNNEFLCVGIIFIDCSGSHSGLRVQYPKEGIVYGLFNSETNFKEIYVNDTFFSNFLNDEFDLLSNGIMGISTHEDTHSQQISHSNGKVKGIDSNLDLSSYEGMKQYLSHYTEIDAHARESAMYLYSQGYNWSEIKQMINQSIQNRKLTHPISGCSAFEKYWNFIGRVAYSDVKTPEQKKIKLECLHVWKRFLMRLMSYLTSSLKYYKLDEYKRQLQKELKSQI